MVKLLCNDGPMLPHSELLRVLHCLSVNSFAGLSFLSPVIGFYCQKCEEFIGDLNSAENHAAIHCHSNSSRVSLVHVSPGKYCV